MLRRRWRAWLTEEAKAELEQAAAAAHPQETGGILIGVLAGGRPWIVHAIEIRSHKSGGSFYELPAGKRLNAVAQLRCRDARLGYLGDWHSHPLDAPPSPTDVASIARLAADTTAGCPRPLLLLTRRVGDHYELDARQLHRRALRQLRLILSGPLPSPSAPPGSALREPPSIDPRTRVGDMANVDLRELLLAKQLELAAGLATSRGVIRHPTDLGTATEIDWCGTLKNFLPARYEVTKATVVDADGEASDAIDLVVYDRHHSPLLFEKNGVIYIPAESVYAIFEVKQELNKSNVDYAAKKAHSVRRLRRTSVGFINAGGESAARELFPIAAGILTTTSSWKEPFGRPLVNALNAATDEARLDLGCSLQHGAFEATYTGAGIAQLETSTPDAGLMFLLLRLFERLRAMGTVPAIDLHQYGRSIED